jgi:hypothetical protein
MKQYIHKTLILCTALFFSACEKVIDIDLNSSEPKVVIEGSITDQPGPYTIRISKTVNFDEPNTFPAVSGAMVQISDDAGNYETLTETATPGIYSTNTIQGVPGRTYTLTVAIAGNTYSAVSTMPQPVSIDTLLVEEFTGPHGSGKVIQARYPDPAGIANFYRFSLFIDNEEEYILLDDDRLQDGELTTLALFSPNPSQGLTDTGDTAAVYMQIIDKGVYEYFRTLYQMSGGSHGGSVSTANPLSNISNGALGYFSAHTIRVKTIVVP